MESPQMQLEIDLEPELVTLIMKFSYSIFKTQLIEDSAFEIVTVYFFY